MVRKNFSEAEKFSGCLVAVVFFSLVEKNFSACVFFSHIQTYCGGPTAFGWGLEWLNAPWLCEWWCSHSWDGHGMVMGVSTGNIPKGGSRGLKAFPSVTAPALAKPWHASAMLPIARALSQMKSFFPSGPDRSIATATNQPEKTCRSSSSNTCRSTDQVVRPSHYPAAIVWSY